MHSNNNELVSYGHKLAAAIGDVELREVAQVITALATQLDVTTAALRAMQSERDQLAAQLADVVAENLSLREYRPQPSGAAMMEALDAFYEYHEDVPEQGMMAAFEILCCKRPQTPATDSFLAEQRAQESVPLVRALKVIANSEQHDGDTVVCDFDTLISVAAGALRDYYAAQLRNEVKV